VTPKEKIEEWVLNTLSEPHNKFGDLPPCPYAKKAWLDGNVEVKMWKDFGSFRYDKWEKEVTIYVMDPYTSPEFLSQIAKNYNKLYPDYLFLEEHPDLVEDVGGFVVNQGELILLIVQERKPLEEARDKLQGTTYYEHWTPEMKERIIER
tara:strand:+ start:1847 stop:2296 length:450 start_codon:yes stop_codon:yes gene_type:complete